MPKVFVLVTLLIASFGVAGASALPSATGVLSTSDAANELIMVAVGTVADPIATERGSSESSASTDQRQIDVVAFFEQGLTSISVTHAGSDEVRAVATIIGEWEVRVVAFDGSKVALGHPFSTGESIYEPVGRDRTELVIVDLHDGTRRDITGVGNIEPEAFSTDGTGLYVIDHRPALAPQFYRVGYVDLRSGERSEVLGPDKQPLDEDMRGTGRSQVYAPDGATLYTVYTRQSVAEHNDHPHLAGFVHILSLSGRFALCVDLPSDFGQGATTAIATSPDGRQIYVVDAAAGKVATLAPTTDLRYTVSVAAIDGLAEGGGPITVDTADGRLTVHQGSGSVGLAVSS